jgi:hypothetical protein
MSSSSRRRGSPHDDGVGDEVQAGAGNIEFSALDNFPAWSVKEIDSLEELKALPWIS